MSFEDRFYSFWNRIEGLEVAEPEDDTICIYALSFQKWIDELANLMDHSNAVAVNQAKILLTDKYFDWERLVPQTHRQRLGVHGHTCIYQVFKLAYDKIRILELSIVPPPLYLPPQPPPTIPKPPNIAGIFIGEGIDDEKG